jgi:hypothetical protein
VKYQTLLITTFVGMDIAYCLMIDHTGVIQQCYSNKANILCELHLAPVDRQLCLEKSISSSSITLNSSTEITIPSASVRIPMTSIAT